MSRGAPLFTVMALLIVAGGSVALALDPLGPPKAGPAAGQFQIGADILYGAADLDEPSDYTVRTFQNGVFQPGQSFSGHDSFKRKNAATSKSYANLGYGILQNWEVFLRLGGASYGLGNDSRLAVGGGTKATFYEIGNWSFGGILQLSWAGWENGVEAEDATTSTKYSVTEGQAALGVCYQFSPHFSLYGGPFATFYKGKAETKGVMVSGTTLTVTEYSQDTDMDAWFGGYLGLRMQIHEKATAAIEFQYTADAYAVAANVACRFGK
jgi:hypothetical protein